MRDLRSAYVTPNINQAGGIIGQVNIQWRNAIEAGILGAILFFLYRFTLANFLSTVPKIIVGFAIIFPVVIVALVGLNGIALSEWIMDIVAYRKTRCFVSLKMPMPESGKLSSSVKPVKTEYKTMDPRVLKQRELDEKQRKKEEEITKRNKEKLEKKEQKKKIADERNKRKENERLLKEQGRAAKKAQKEKEKELRRIAKEKERLAKKEKKDAKENS